CWGSGSPCPGWAAGGGGSPAGGSDRSGVAGLVRFSAMSWEPSGSPARVGPSGASQYFAPPRPAPLAVSPKLRPRRARRAQLRRSCEEEREAAPTRGGEGGGAGEGGVESRCRRTPPACILDRRYLALG